MSSDNQFTISILTHNRKEKLVKLIDSILFYTPMDRINEIVIYNNNSTDGSIQELNNRYGKNEGG